MGSAVPPGGTRRVRHVARDGLAVMAFSVTTSAAFAALMLVLTRAVARAGN